MVVVALALAGCGGVAKPSASVETPARSGVDAADQPPRTTEQARLNEQVGRVAGELSELQNAVAKLLGPSRHRGDQLTFLRRRLEALESQSGSRQLPSAPSGFAPSPPLSPAPSAGATLLAAPSHA